MIDHILKALPLKTGKIEIIKKNKEKRNPKARPFFSLSIFNIYILIHP